MRKIIYISSVIAVGFSCQESTNNDESEVATNEVIEIEENQKIDSANTVTEKEDLFSISDFKIGERKIGPIQIGMTVEETEQELSDFTKEETTSYEFKYGGGGPVYIYKYNEEPVLATMTGYNSDTVRILVALHEDLKTLNGLSPKSSVAEIVETYPSIMVNQDLMSGGEFIKDTLHNWSFVFDTNDDNEIGEYPVVEVPSEPKRLNATADWIIVR